MIIGFERGLMILFETEPIQNNYFLKIKCYIYAKVMSNKFKNFEIMRTLLILCIFIISTNFCFARNFSTLEEKVEHYKNRYKVECLNQRITDNRGNGFEELYGTRNMRTILFGVAYRGGGNNYFHRTNKRENRNPLPNDGLENLNNEGFSKAVYLYLTNFSTAPRYVTNGTDTLRYVQNSGLTRNTQKEILQIVYDRINEPNLGPVYLHCWNGWHQCGFIAALVLMQFCGFSNEKALKYWYMNAEGTKGFDTVKRMMSEFKPFDDFQIAQETQELICPCFEK